MKAIFVIVVHLLSFSFIYSQNRFITIEKEEEIKGKNNTYIKTDYGSENSQVYNKNYELMFRQVDLGGYYTIPSGKIINKLAIHEAVKENILPYVKKYIDTFERTESLVITCISELDGIVKELIFYYPTKWEIPITVLEELEKTLLNTPIRLDYEKDHIIFTRVSKVSATYSYGKERFTILRDSDPRFILDKDFILVYP